MYLSGGNDGSFAVAREPIATEHRRSNAHAYALSAEAHKQGGAGDDNTVHNNTIRPPGFIERTQDVIMPRAFLPILFKKSLRD